MSKESLDYSILCPNYYTNWEEGCCMETCTHNDLDLCPIHYVKGLLEDKDQQIAELEEQLSNAIIPKFKVGQEIWEITPLMSWKIKRIEWHKFNGGNGDIVMEIYRLGHDGTDDYNCCTMPVDSDRFFATEEEAKAKLEELKNE